MSEHSPSGTQLPTQYRPIGVALAIGSGVFIGASFVVKKKGLIASQGGNAAGEGVAYLKNPVWWTGMTMMIVGEIMNFGAYAFVEAIVVTPLGALSVVVCAILSSWFLKEKLTTLGWLACAECIFGSVIIALNGPREDAVATIQDFKEIFLAPWFLSWGAVCLATCLALIIFAVPRWGEKSMLVYVIICSLFGGLSVSCIQGLGAAILTTIRGENQFKNWFIYFLIVFVVSTLVAEIFFLNKALALFNTAMVTPTYYVIFTFCVIVTSAILYQGFKASASTIITLVLAFLTICAGITLLQLSRVDPRKLNVDEKTNLLLAANQQEIENPEEQDPEKAIEDPGIDALRAFGTLGTINRARRRTIYDESGNIVRRGTIYSQRGTMYSQNGHSGSLASPIQLRKRLPSNNATVTTPNGSTIAHPQLPSPPPNAHVHSHQGPGHVAFPRPTSIAETDESEPTMSALLRRDNFTASPTPVSPNSSYLGVRPAMARIPSASSTLRQHQKSEPTTPTTTEPVKQELQRPMSMPDMKEQIPEMRDLLPDTKDQLPDTKDQLPDTNEQLPDTKNQLPEQTEEGEATIKVQKPTP